MNNSNHLLLIVTVGKFIKKIHLFICRYLDKSIMLYVMVIMQLFYGPYPKPC
nr:hypothetical protein [Oceanobacillus jeddahense]